MLTPLVLFALTGLSLFYFQNLALYPHVQVRLVSLLIFAVGLRHPLATGFSLAVLLGLTQDAYALTPLGLHLMGGLLLLAAARICRRGVLLAGGGTQILACLAALGLEELGLRLILFLLGYPAITLTGLLGVIGLEILATAALAPLMFAWLTRVEKALSRLGWRPVRGGL